MRYRFFLDGQAYSKNKASFKKLLKKHGMKYKGSFGNFVWSSEKETVRAEFERDEERDVTIKATLFWEGRRKTELMEELKAWVWEHGGKSDKDETPAPKSSEIKSKIEKELEFWDSINKPNVERLKAAGRPEEWIKRDVEAWKKQRRAKKRELTGRYAS